MLTASSELYLSPSIATVVFVIAVVAGYQYRRVWKANGPKWQLWIFGSAAAVCLITVGFIPLRFS